MDENDDRFTIDERFENDDEFFQVEHGVVLKSPNIKNLACVGIDMTRWLESHLLKLLSSRCWEEVLLGQGGRGYQEIIQAVLRLDCCKTLKLGGMFDIYDYDDSIWKDGIGSKLEHLNLQDMFISAVSATSFGLGFAESSVKFLRFGGVIFENRKAAATVANAVLQNQNLQAIRFFSDARFDFQPPRFSWENPGEVDDRNILLFLESLSVLAALNESDDDSSEKKLPEILVEVLPDSSISNCIAPLLQRNFIVHSLSFCLTMERVDRMDLFAEGLAETDFLKTLDFDSTSFTTEDIRHLINGLQSNTSLEALVIRVDSRFEEQGVIDFITALPCLTLRSLEILNANEFGAESGKDWIFDAFCSAMEKNRSIEFLYLQGMEREMFTRQRSIIEWYGRFNRGGRRLLQNNSADGFNLALWPLVLERSINRLKFNDYSENGWTEECVIDYDDSIKLQDYDDATGRLEVTYGLLRYGPILQHMINSHQESRKRKRSEVTSP